MGPKEMIAIFQALQGALSYVFEGWQRALNIYCFPWMLAITYQALQKRLSLKWVVVVTVTLSGVCVMAVDNTLVASIDARATFYGTMFVQVALCRPFSPNWNDSFKAGTPILISYLASLSFVFLFLVGCLSGAAVLSGRSVESVTNYFLGYGEPQRIV
jgi:hypothetical protein